MRILNPGSKNKPFETKDKFILDFSGLALDNVYDVTTFYFESFDSDELRARGMSKENKTNEVQVVLGLLADGEGIPIDYQLFRGNTSEMNTIVEVVNDYKTQNHLERVTVVADRGLNSRLNLKTLTDLNFDYIVAQEGVKNFVGALRQLLKREPHMKRKPDPFDKYAEQLPEDMKKSGREIKSSGES